MRTLRRGSLAIVAIASGFLLTESVAAQVPTEGGQIEKAPPPRPAIDPPPGTILAADESLIDLGTELQLAGVENPELLLARQRVTEATAIRQLAAAQVLPNLNVGTNYDNHRGALQQSTGNMLNVNRVRCTSALEPLRLAPAQ